jgi:hypothetical protein
MGGLAVNQGLTRKLLLKDPTKRLIHMRWLGISGIAGD